MDQKEQFINSLIDKIVMDADLIEKLTAEVARLGEMLTCRGCNGVCELKGRIKP